MTVLYVVRHVQAQGNKNRTFTGLTDVDVTSLGIQQGERLAQRFADEPITAILTSDLIRARKTADCIASRHSHLQIFVNPDVREVNAGSWEGQDFEKIRREQPEMYAAFYAASPDFRPGGDGESVREVAMRMRAAADSFVAEHMGKTVVLVSHGCAIAALMKTYGSSVGWGGNATVSKVIYPDDGGAPTIEYLWSDDHLSGLASSIAEQKEYNYLKSSTKAERVRVLDGLRGIAIFMMVLYHLCFDIANVFFDGSAFAEFFRSIYLSPLVESFLQPLFQCLFVLISGIACRYSRSNIKRGAIALGIGLGLEALTCIILPAINKDLFYGCEIRFGILSCLGACMLMWGLCGKLFDKIYTLKNGVIVYPITLIILWFAFYVLSDRSYGFEYMYWLGFPSRTFSSADYFPILPWVFCFLFGTFIGKYIRDGKFPQCFYKIRIPFFDFIGKYTLWIYILHQPVVFGFCCLLFKIINAV